jgi:hypothetical protein
MPNEVILSKGSYSTTVYTRRIEDGFKNKLTTITPAKGKGSQADGPKDTKVVDLLRLTRSFRIDGFVLSNTDKSNLIKIVEGAGINGGTITLTFSEGGDATSFDVFIESIIFVYESQDEPSSPPDDFAKHSVNISLIKGVTI